MQAIGKNVIAKAVYQEKTTKVLTLEVEKPIYYEILSVGNDVTCLTSGDKVIILQYGTHVFKHEGQDFYLISLDNIVARL